MVKKTVLCLDAGGVLRGECKKCRGCKSFIHPSGEMIRFKPEDKHKEYPDPSAMTFKEKREAWEKPCQGCGCPAHQHESLDSWLVEARDWVTKFHDSDGVWPKGIPPCSCLPSAAREWDPIGAALHVVTGSQFDPSRDGREAMTDAQLGERERLASVVCTSIEKNHPSHPLLYECFRRQTHDPKELVVVDTGTQPSAFFQECAKKDPRVTYRFFFREEHGLEQEEDPLEHVMKDDSMDEVLQFVQWTPEFGEENDTNRAEVPCQGLSLGLKRNIGIYLSRGSILMHFNAGDMYGSNYITHMRSELLSNSSQETWWIEDTVCALSHSAAAMMADWHAVDISTAAFRRLDIKDHGHHLPEEMKKSMQCQRGFTFAYTRRTWENAPFPNVEDPEGHLPKLLKTNKVPLTMVKLPKNLDGLACHGYDKENAGGADFGASINIAIEIRDLVDCSFPVATPWAFEELLPALNQMSEAVNKSRMEGINSLLEAEGPTFFCTGCDAAIALHKFLKESKKLSDGAGGRVEVSQFSRAGGALAEGERVYEKPVAARPPAPMPAWQQRGPQQRLPANGYPPQRPMHQMAGGVKLSLPMPSPAQFLTPPGARNTWNRGGPLLGGGIGPATRAMNTQPSVRPLFNAGQYQPPRNLLSSARQPDPEPQDTAWFPSWYHRNALCRRCGKNIGWRYERGSSMFWVFETQHLRERKPEPQAPAERRPVQAAVAAQAAVESKPEPAASSVKEPMDMAKQERAQGAATPATETRTDEDRAASSKAPAPPSKDEGKAMSKEEKSLASCRDAIRPLSRELLEALAHCLAGTDKARFDQALNEMKIDDATREKLLLELRIRPGVAVTQKEQLIVKAFRGKVNVLRSLGLRVLRVALEEVLPAGFMEEVAKSSASAGACPSGSPPAAA